MQTGLMIPYRSVAGALIFTILCGPIGLFYASLLGGIAMTSLSLVACGMVIAQQSPYPMATVWLLSIIWAMIEVRWYNGRMWKRAVKLGQNESQQKDQTSH
jgi:hypothetical protein